MPGELVTATQLNTHLRDNLNAVRQGGLSLVSQAALDFVYCSSTAQLDRLTGTALQFPRLNATATAWEFASSRQGYTPTLANVANTASKTTVVSTTITGGDFVDGCVVQLRVAALVKNNKGTAGTVLYGISYAGVADASPTTLAVQWPNDTLEYMAIYEFQMMRVGADLWLSLVPFDQGNVATQLVQIPQSYFSVGQITGAGGSYGGGNARKIASPDFTTNQTLALNITLSAADLNFYIKPQSANIRRTII